MAQRPLLVAFLAAACIAATACSSTTTAKPDATPDAAPDGSPSDAVILDDLVCTGPISLIYLQPGCPGVGHQTCPHLPAGLDSALAVTLCSCQGATIFSNAAYSVEPYAHAGPCEDGGSDTQALDAGAGQ
jgi:hypothetical protein